MEAWGQQYQFLAVTRLEAGRSQLVALLPTGQPLLSLDYDGKALKQENLSSMDIRGEDILSIMQFALWPEISISLNYPPEEGWQVEMKPQERVLLNDSGAVLKVRYEKKGMTVENYLRNYRVEIQTLEKTEL
ncbi:DUF3261 domain-containing protein [Marinobacterium sp. CAU 1594]|nr:DUF3261 domain-containing protein [Marinobacterium arenosum]